MTLLTPSHDTSRTSLNVDATTNKPPHLHKKSTVSIPNRSYVRKIQALALLMLTARAGGTQAAQMQQAPTTQKNLTTHINGFSQRATSEHNETNNGSFMGDDWFCASDANFESHLLRSKNVTTQLASHFDSAISQTLDTLITQLTEQPAGHSAKDIQPDRGDLNQTSHASVLDTEDALGASSAPPLPTTNIESSPATEQSPHSEDNSANYERFLRRYIFLRLFAVVGAKLLTQSYLRRYEPSGYPDGVRRTRNSNNWRRDLTSDLYRVATTILIPLSQALMGAERGANRIKKLAGACASASTINSADTSAYILLGALPFTITTLAQLLPKLYRSHTVPTADYWRNHLDFFVTLSEAQTVGGRYLRDDAAMMGALGATVFGNRTQTVAETGAVVLAAQMPYLALRPLFWLGNRFVERSATLWTYRLDRDNQTQTPMQNQNQTRPLNTRNLQMPLPNPRSSTAIQEKINRLTQLRSTLDQATIEDLLPEYCNDLYMCPLSLELVRDPVVLPTDTNIFHYEKSFARHWINTSNKHPHVRNFILPNKRLISDSELQAAVNTWLDDEIELATRAHNLLNQSQEMASRKNTVGDKPQTAAQSRAHFQSTPKSRAQPTTLTAIDKKVNALEQLQSDTAQTPVEDLLPKHCKDLFVCNSTHALMRDPVAVIERDRVRRFDRHVIQSSQRGRANNPPLYSDATLKSAIESWLDSEIKQAKDEADERQRDEKNRTKNKATLDN